VALAGSEIDQRILDRVAKGLAAYIGPIAELVVKRAAKRCTSIEDLCGNVAQEIESEPDRHRFLKSCGG
jgi:serine/threonine-protein kinase